MPVQSKILSPVSVSSGSEGIAYRHDSHAFLTTSPAPFQNNRRAFVKRESGTFSGPRSLNNTVSRLASASASARHSHASRLASASAPVHHSRQALIPTSREDRLRPAFSNRENLNPPEFQTLHAENTSLKQELDGLYDQFDIISYVLITLSTIKTLKLPAVKSLTLSLRKLTRLKTKSRRCWNSFTTQSPAPTPPHNRRSYSRKITRPSSGRLRHGGRSGAAARLKTLTATRRFSACLWKTNLVIQSRTESRRKFTMPSNPTGSISMTAGNQFAVGRKLVCVGRTTFRYRWSVSSPG